MTSSPRGSIGSAPSPSFEKTASGATRVAGRRSGVPEVEVVAVVVIAVVISVVAAVVIAVVVAVVAAVVIAVVVAVVAAVVIAVVVAAAAAAARGRRGAAGVREWRSRGARLASARSYSRRPVRYFPFAAGLGGPIR